MSSDRCRLSLTEQTQRRFTTSIWEIPSESGYDEMVEVDAERVIIHYRTEILFG